jgi:hypothetical protein
MVKEQVSAQGVEQEFKGRLLAAETTLIYHLLEGVPLPLALGLQSDASHEPVRRGLNPIIGQLAEGPKGVVILHRRAIEETEVTSITLVPEYGARPGAVKSQGEFAVDDVVSRVEQLARGC